MGLVQYPRATSLVLHANYKLGGFYTKHANVSMELLAEQPFRN
jgi:hypothetical protein